MNNQSRELLWPSYLPQERIHKHINADSLTLTVPCHQTDSEVLAVQGSTAF